MSNQIIKSSKEYSPTRARSFNVKTSIKDYAQYVTTIKAYASAGMPFEHIANAGEALGDFVERLELDAHIQEGWKQKIGEIAENPGQVMAWQSRGEKVPVSHQLSSSGVTGMEMVTISQDLTVPNQEQTIDVVEAVAVSESPSQQLENNPFLKSPASLK